ncbi:MAG: class I SAM-dependent methyltransferase [Burkholderiales bacterium]|nr:class I SAM-dependent methyltransferase [Burkholderiales bacterium]
MVQGYAGSFVLACAILCNAPPVTAQAPHTHQHSFGDAAKWAKVFDDPSRDAWQKPHEVIAALALPPDAVVADIGAGTGYFAVRLARMLPKGRVYAIDIEPDMVRHLETRARREGLSHVAAIKGEFADPRIPAPVDLILLVNVYHHIDARERYFAQLRSSLKPGGRIAVIDFRMSAPVGPPRAARIAPEEVVAELGRAGYAPAGEHSFLPNQYFLLFTPALR